MTQGGDPVAPAELVAGKYRLSRLLGQGGMGSVWEGVHASLGTRVAVKFIDAEYAESPEARNRFVNEAKAAATLHSKHVVKVHDHGVMNDGRPYIVMEFLAGEPLDKKLDREHRITPAECSHIVVHVARALTKAHQAGIVHRDLKPENVFLVWDEEDQANIAKVVDFGIAKFTEGGLSSSSSATRTGSVLGTPHYMSPEQARGLRSVNYRSDLWSLGVIVYRCLVGRLPFDGEAVGDLLVKICTAPVPVPSELAPELPRTFDAWLAKCLSREPEQRFESASELAEQLSLALGVTTRAPLPSAMALAPPSGGAHLGMPTPAENPTLAAPAGAVPVGSQNTMADASMTRTPGLPVSSGKGAYMALAGVAGLAVAGVVLAFAFGGSGSKEPAAEGVTSVAPPAVSATAPTVAPVPPVPSVEVAKVDAGVPVAVEPAPSPPPAAAAPRVGPRPGPRPAAPKAQAAPAPAPAPRPAPKGGGVDIGY